MFSRLRLDHCGAHSGVGGPGSVEELWYRGRRGSSIQQLDASVWPPQAGKPLTLNYRSVLTETLTNGSLEHLTMTWPSGRVSDVWLPFQPPAAVLFNYALFGHYPLQQTKPLPIPAGPYSQSLTLRVPEKGPATQPLGVDMTGYDATGRQVVCMQLLIPIK